MVLANVFHNGPHASGLDTPTTASRIPGRATAGLTLRQSTFGMEYHGPASVWGGHVRGSMAFDFFEGLSETTFPPVRLRTAGVSLDWPSRSVSFLLDKPLISLRDPFSLSYSGISPLTSSGNLWRWQPQLRFEQRGRLSDANSFIAQVAIVQTTEDSGLPAGFNAAQLERRRPGLQGRFEFRHSFDDQRHISIAPGFHVSRTHVAGAVVPSNVYSLDWLATPSRWLEVSGLFWNGRNVHHFGALRQSYTTLGGKTVPVHSKGGWGQVTVPFTDRLSFNLIAGIHDDRDRELAVNAVGSNRTGGANVVYRLAPNVLMSLEALQIRTAYTGAGTRINNRYDLAVAYLF
jgi:hypothetical protein